MRNNDLYPSVQRTTQNHRTIILPLYRLHPPVRAADVPIAAAFDAGPRDPAFVVLHPDRPFAHTCKVVIIKKEGTNNGVYIILIIYWVINFDIF